MKTTILLALAIMIFALPMVSQAANPVQQVPEPATGLLLLLGGAAAAAFRTARNRR